MPSVIFTEITLWLRHQVFSFSKQTIIP